MSAFVFFWAEARLLQVAEEAAAIHRAFPELRRVGGAGGHLPGPAGSEPKPRRNRQLSAAGRKAISDAAKARWARKKAEKESSGKKGGKKR